jgi:hypothetical protein
MPNKRKPPNKPTRPFGYIAFGKDGSGRKHMEQLSPIKAEQEIEVGRRFATGLNSMLGKQYEAVPCEENDHDFWLIAVRETILVQAAEVVSRDYLHPLTKEDYFNWNHSFSNFVVVGPDEHAGVDEAARDEVLLDRIKAKVSKHYAKPAHPLWLLVWTVESSFPSFWIEGGKHCVSTGVEIARKYLTANGAGPFDEIWFLALLGNPKRLWPT